MKYDTQDMCIAGVYALTIAAVIFFACLIVGAQSNRLVVGTNVIYATNYFQVATPSMRRAFVYDGKTTWYFSGYVPTTNVLKIQVHGTNVIWATNAAVLTNILIP